MFKLFSTIVFAIALFSDLASSESSSSLVQSWSKLDLPMYGNLIHPVEPVSSHYHRIKVVGKLRGSDKFHINLISGNDWNSDDVPLHVRIDTKNKNIWTATRTWKGGDMRVYDAGTNSPNPLKPDEQFVVEIVIKHTHYDILINGKVVQRPLHQLSPKAVSYVHLYCDAGASVHLQSVSREYPLYAPSQL